MKKTTPLFLLIFVLFLTVSCSEKEVKYEKQPEHPSLILTVQGVKEIRSQLGTVPLFDKTLARTIKIIDVEIAKEISLSTPKDLSGGFSHEQHKNIFLILQQAGVLFQITQDEKYAQYVKEVLLAYAKLYPTLPVHPQTRSYARGKLFWQCLNDSNWLVYSSQAYDCIYEWLTPEDRNILENDLFIPFANFISIENPQFFNRVHNHSTWGNSAVGMIALVMGNDDLLNKALYGIPTDSIDANMKDNDGGFIKTEGQKVGFLANIDEPFSPDGYYTEGPYYQRYAMYPFLIFAQALHNVKPELKIFDHKNGVLLKAVNAILMLTDQDGEFFPLNDGQKGMSIQSRELVTAVDIAYKYGGHNQQLLSIAQEQGKVLLNDSGLAVAKGLRDGKAIPFIKKSYELTDGPEGDQGAVGVLRSGDIEVVFKYSAQGLSHGHYDKLSFSMYNEGNEIIQDYGLVRFVNIEQKGGGNYLKENKTWAKESIAHNTIIQNEKSHFDHKYEIASKNHSTKYIFNTEDLQFQIASAKEENAYPGTELHRTMVLVKDVNNSSPYLLDIMRIQAAEKNQYDLPYYYLGHIMSANFEYETFSQLNILGPKNGYQHLWKKAEGIAQNPNTKISWLNNDKFYSLTTTSDKNDKILFAQIGANDPDFNLRNDPAIIIRRNNFSNTTFATIIEPHGHYSPVSELAKDATSSIENIEIIQSNSKYTVLKITKKDASIKTVFLSNIDSDKNTKHELQINNQKHQWSGPFYYINTKQ
ncbi:heparinase II/III family protein [Flavicella sp.]|uniref:heparinase II/III domain-containing protein n=1 Tax=Flavicella sp. TaxID=2957742 RepID=UPI00301A7175